MKNIVVFNWATGKKFTGNKVKEALKDIIVNGSQDYSYTFSMAQRTIEFFNISL